jgi:hypothetical protein
VLWLGAKAERQGNRKIPALQKALELAMGALGSVSRDDQRWAHAKLETLKDRVDADLNGRRYRPKRDVLEHITTKCGTYERWLRLPLN